MNQANAIRIEGLIVRYRGRPAVDGLSFDVPAGSVFGSWGRTAGEVDDDQVAARPDQPE